MKQAEQFLDIPQLMARHHLKSRQTAAKRMREMAGRINTRPMLVPLSAVEAWERERNATPTAMIRAAMRIKRRM